MPTKTWKSIEAHVAKLFGTTRAPLSGGNGRQTRSDSLSSSVFVETKYRASIPWITLFKQVAELAGREGKLPVVAIVAKGDRTPYIVAPLDAAYLRALLENLDAAAPPDVK